MLLRFPRLLIFAAAIQLLSVYTHAYVARLIEVLATDYPTVRVAMGDWQFEHLAVDYVRAHPSHSFSLRDFGRHLPGFVSDLIQHHDDYQDSHWLYELGLFEWTLGQAFDAADDSLLTEQDMAAIPLAVQTAASVPSMAARYRERTSRVGLKCRL